MEVKVAVAKVPKWATRESGDTLEMIERPRGGISFVLVDGQRSGRSAKAIANLVARKAIGELAEGVRDGAAARAAHDYLHAYKGGKVSATLNIVSVDLSTRTLVLSRNNPCPAILVTPEGEVCLLDEPSQPVGFYAGTKPVISEWPLQAGTTVIVYTDGIAHAGKRQGRQLNVVEEVRALATRDVTAQEMADFLLERALVMEENRPGDDISVLVLQVRERVDEHVRRLSLSMPIHS